MMTVSKIILSVLIFILVSPGFSQEIKGKFSVSAGYSFISNNDYGKDFHTAEIAFGYSVNDYVKPLIGLSYYTVDEDNLYYGKPRFNKLDLDIGLETRFFKSKMFNLALQTKIGLDIYSNARKKPLKYLNIQDQYYEYNYFDDYASAQLSDGIYNNSFFCSNYLLFSVYFKSFELKLGPGYQLGVYFFEKGIYKKHLVNSYNGTVSLTYYF